MHSLDQEITLLNEGIVWGLGFGTLLVVAYFRYGKDTILTLFADIFIKFSLIKRDKRDLLVFAAIPYGIAFLSLIGRIMLI